KGSKVFPGKMAFKMYDTYGFPPELTEEIVLEAGLSFDRENFERYMEKHRQIARAGSSPEKFEEFDPVLMKEIEKECPQDKGKIFVGYDNLSCEAETLFLIREGKPVKEIEENQEGEVIFSCTPFYPEGGGQVSDTGKIIFPQGSAQVIEVKKRAGFIFHGIRVIKNSLKKGEVVKLEVDRERRLRIARAHTCTHLLHAALRHFLGSGVRQSGSLVEEERLRFDFTFPSPVEEKTLREISLLVNEKIQEDIPIIKEEKSIEEAQAEGAIALFEEKYEKKVRVVKIGDFSKEVCGGTHLDRTGSIGVFHIISESAIAAGVRRIEAFCGKRAFLWLLERESYLKKITSMLSVPEERIIQKIEERENMISMLQKKLEKMQKSLLEEKIEKIAKEAVDIKGFKFCREIFQDIPPEILRETAEKLKKMLGEALVILASVINKKAFMVAASSNKEFPADKMLREVAFLVGGKGGGRWDFAQGGTSNPEKLREIFKDLPCILKDKII
ncbi:alanine--tRNA ligase, partial [Candidatus Aerophobetes bacterium]|nr:alanine--tRNA ligase [Candidatus Aerophobetes bacterium]